MTSSDDLWRGNKCERPIASNCHLVEEDADTESKPEVVFITLICSLSDFSREQRPIGR